MNMSILKLNMWTLNVRDKYLDLECARQISGNHKRYPPSELAMQRENFF